jgi:aspartyl-tRNA(Asn)/glutamyl-tRNA(Gln) amidotransferase subunit A
VDRAGALTAARAADQAGYGATAPALRGIPIALKDNIITQGLRTTCASKILGDYKPPYDADVTRRLKAQGAVILGKLNMDEFAMGGSNENSAFGPVKNPVDPTRVPGGSSGGSAAAVKAHAAPATLGSDTGGSIRLPASYCGVLGLKPTYGLVSRYGLVAFASSLDQIGPLTEDADDAALMLSAIAGREKGDDHGEQDAALAAQPAQDYSAALDNEFAAIKSGKKLRIGWSPDLFHRQGTQKEVVDAVDSALAALKAAGHAIVETRLPHVKQAVAVYYIVAVSEASSNLSRFDGVRFGARAPGATLNEVYTRTRALFGAEVKRRIVLGTYALSAGYYDAYYKKACQVRRLISQDLEKAFASCDLILSPVAPSTAFKLGDKADPLQMYLNDLLTIPANLAGIPAVSVPRGKDQAGLPIGIQLMGPHFSEARLLAVAKLLQAP